MMPATIFMAAFKQERLGFMFSAIMVIMVYLGSLAMAAQATLARTSLTWGHNLQNKLTVEVPNLPDEILQIREDRADKVIELLKKNPEITDVRKVSEQEAAQLVKPWVADPALLAALPLPTLLDVELKKDHSIRSEVLEAELSQEILGTQVHSHAAWMDKLLAFLRGLGFLSVVMLVLTALAIVASISVVCRAAMAVQHETIELLHFMGATDRTIARQFEKHIRVLAFPATAIGFLAALVTTGCLAWLLNALGGFSLIASASWITVGAVMAIVPVCAILLAIGTARWSILKLLRRLA